MSFLNYRYTQNLIYLNGNNAFLELPEMCFIKRILEKYDYVFQKRNILICLFDIFSCETDLFKYYTTELLISNFYD